MSYSLGQKIKRFGNVLGAKIKQGERLGMKIGGGLDKSGRQVSSVARRVAGGLTAVQPYLQGTPLGAGASILRDVALGVSAGGKEARKIGQGLEKISERGLAKLAEDRLAKEASNFM